MTTPIPGVIPREPPCSRDDLDPYLSAFTNFERQHTLPTDRRELGPARCRRLIERACGLPRSTRVIQVAGSKGKGSTVLWLEMLLTHRGASVTATLSPHLEQIEERIRIDGRTSRTEEFLSAIATLHPTLQAIDRQDPTLRPTFFDLMTAATVAVAMRRQSAWLLLEVGLGGPLDSTSAVPHNVGVLTTVDLEHCAQLGDTLGEIASEKARIATAGTPFLIGAGSDASAIEAATTIARSRGAIPRVVGDDPRIPPALLPPQRGNLALALAAAEAAGAVPFERPEIERAIETISLPARLELLRGPPPLLLDGAHTLLSLTAFADRLRTLRAGRPATVLVGAMHDKSWRSGLAPLLAEPEIEWIATSAGGPRAAPPEEIAGEIAAAGRSVLVLPLEAAVAKLRDSGDRALAVTGSFHLAGAVRRLWRAPVPERPSPADPPT